MTRFNPVPPTASDERGAPVACPSCQSTVIVTTSKKPGADCYWRCTKCGEVWNASRMPTGAYGRNRWP
jgi:predicted Zn finger-like uncharacterized protein